jgi:hypothetical protein
MRYFLALAIVLFTLGNEPVLCAQPVVCPVGKTPLSVEGNAPIVSLRFRRQDGTTRVARFVFDSGGGAVLIDDALASDLGLRPSGAEIVDSAERYAPVTMPPAMIGGFSVSLATSKAFIHLGARSFDPREHIEGLLPGKALEPYQVVIDYPHRLFSVAAAGCIRDRGVEVESPFLPASGHPRVVVTVSKRKYGFLLDTGSRVSLARRDLLESLSAAHPEWPHSTGASGVANMPGGNGQEFLLRVPEIEWGAFHLRNVLFASRPDETYSTANFETPESIVGALGGNVLSGFRVEIDYPHGKTYLEKIHEPDPNDMNSAGLVLDVNTKDQLVVVAVSSTADAITRRNVRPGDIILRIAGKREAPWAITDSSQALSGKVGKRIGLLLLRDGVTVHTTVNIAHLI